MICFEEIIIKLKINYYTTIYHYLFIYIYNKMNELLKKYNFNSVTKQDNDGWNILMHACQKLDVQAVKLILEKGYFLDFLNQKNFNKKNVLMIACYHDNIDIFNLILQDKRFKCLNKQDIWGMNTLMHACNYGQVEHVKLILQNERAIEFNAVDNQKRNILIHACIGGSFEIVKMILSRERFKMINRNNMYDMNALMFSCYVNDCDGAKIARLLLNSRDFKCLNKKDRFGRTTLMIAVEENRYLITKELLKQKDIIVKSDILTIQPELPISIYELGIKHWPMMEFPMDRTPIKTLLEEYLRNPSYVRTNLLLQYIMYVYHNVMFTQDNFFEIIKIKVSD